MILNLGSGERPIEGAINLDLSKDTPMVDVAHDLEITPLPFSNDCFDTVVALHIMEHIRNFIPLMNDLWRICKNNAEIYIDVPHWMNPLHYDDPTHVRQFNENTLTFMCDKKNASKIGLKGMFHVEQLRTVGEPWHIDLPLTISAKLRVEK